MVSPGKYDLRVYKANDFTFTLTVEVGGSTLDLSGASVYSQVREDQYLDSDLVIDFTVKIDDTLLTNPATTNNEIELSLTDLQTIDLEAGEYYYDLLVVDSSGVDTTYLRGKVFIYNTVTVKP